jgi:hypothetical protein
MLHHPSEKDVIGCPEIEMKVAMMMGDSDADL